jgi:hypothetical protein
MKIVPLIYHLPALYGSPAERDALLEDIKARGILEAHDLGSLIDYIRHILDDADVRIDEAHRETKDARSGGMSDAELAIVEAKITSTFDDLIQRHPALSDDLIDACAGLIHEVR